MNEDDWAYLITNDERVESSIENLEKVILDFIKVYNQNIIDLEKALQIKLRKIDIEKVRKMLNE